MTLLTKERRDFLEKVFFFHFAFLGMCNLNICKYVELIDRARHKVFFIIQLDDQR